MDAQNANVLATLTTEVVVPESETMVPIQIDNTNCARKTILETIAISVPNPRTCPQFLSSPSGVNSN